MARRTLVEKEHLGHRERMRQRFRQNGLNGFAPHEVVELLLFYAIPQRDVNPLAHRLIKRFGSLHGVLDASVEELMQEDGMGEYAATLLSLVSRAAKELDMSRISQKRLLTTRRDAEEYCIHLLSGLQQEHFYMVCLNGQMELLGNVLISSGTLSEVTAYPRLVAEGALRYNAHTVVLCHNHPGGSMVPSQQDVELTARLAQLLSGIEVRLADHIIVANGESLSMARCGLLVPEDAGSGLRAADSSGQLLMRNRLQMAGKGKTEE